MIKSQLYQTNKLTCAFAKLFVSLRSTVLSPFGYCTSHQYFLPLVSVLTLPLCVRA